MFVLYIFLFLSFFLSFSFFLIFDFSLPLAFILPLLVSCVCSLTFILSFSLFFPFALSLFGFSFIFALSLSLLRSRFCFHFRSPLFAILFTSSPFFLLSFLHFMPHVFFSPSRIFFPFSTNLRYQGTVLYLHKPPIPISFPHR